MGNLVSFNAMLEHARKHGYAVPAFNVSNMETIQAVVCAADEKHSPLIAQLYHADLEYAGADFMIANSKTAALKVSVPVCVSLDHGRSFMQAKKCIEAGFTGVMIDLSEDSFEKNIQTTKEVVDYAHERGVSVEAELGTIFDASEADSVRTSGFTDPAQAKIFIQKTGVDALAVSIGTAHGVYSSKPTINFSLAEELVKTLDVPIVVHGGSNTPDEDIIRLCKLGVAKINIGTDLMQAYNDGILNAFQEHGKSAPLRVVMGQAREYVKATAKQKIDLLRTYARA